MIIPLFLYCCAIFLHVYHYRYGLRDAYVQGFWDGAMKTVAVFWEAQGRIWHGKTLKSYLFYIYIPHFADFQFSTH